MAESKKAGRPASFAKVQERLIAAQAQVTALQEEVRTQDAKIADLERIIADLKQAHAREIRKAQKVSQQRQFVIKKRFEGRK